jgi:DNA polymerase-3 subunit alpha
MLIAQKETIMTDFVHLHAHTHFSLLDALSTPKELFQRAKELGQSALAITEHGSMASIWDALKASKETGVKLIAGCEMYFVDDVDQVEGVKFRHIILLAKNAIGYSNLLTLNKKGFDHRAVFTKRVYPLIDWKLLEKHSEGLICLTSCSNGIIAQLVMNKNFEQAETQLLKLKSIFGDDLGLEVQANTLHRPATAYSDPIEQIFVNAQLIKLSRKHNVRAVATANVHYCKKEEAETHDVLLAVGSHQPVYSNFRLKYECPEFYLKSGEEVRSFFERNYSELAEELCSNTLFFANRCEEPQWIDPKFSNPTGKELPIFPVKNESDYLEFTEWKNKQIQELQNLDEDKLYLRFKCDRNFEDRILGKIAEEKLSQYRERVLEELDVLEFHGFSSYMLIVADYISWARRNNILVGPGRGSVGGSLIAYLLNIHQADPIKYGLIFARFHNKEKSAFPDIDQDIAPSGREKIQEYLRQKYGEEHVAHVSNVNTITPKVYARDIARACEFGGDREEAVQIGNDIADSIPKEITTVESALEKAPLFDEYAKRYTALRQYMAINGKYRAWSTHAGGIVISKRPLTGLIPLRKDKDGTLALEYDKEKAEENGLVKMDILGLSTLDIMNTTLQLIKRAGKPLPPEPFDYGMEDQATYDLISSGDTFCVFQLGTSSGTIDLCKKIKPKSIEDISHINALARPSAREIRSAFVAAKEGKKAVALLHPNLQRAFGGTFGFGLYEESLMYLAQDVAGWSLHSADRLRKLTKDKGKNPKKVQQWRAEFINDAMAQGVNEEIAKRIWDEVVDKFGGYGFNLSHSVLYSMISFQTAYLKAHYPIEFLLANLMAEINSNTPDAKGNISQIKKELRKHKVKIIPPNLNQSQLSYTLTENKLITGLDALKFVGEDAIQDIIEKRPFKDFFDFMVRISSKKVRANAIQALAAAGCLDDFGLSRRSIFFYCSDYRKKLQVWLKNHDPKTEKFVYPWPEEPEWSSPELYALEQYYLGDAFCCGYKEAYGAFFKDQNLSASIEQVRKMPDRSRFKSVRGVIQDIFEFRVKKETSKYFGKAMIKATLQDVKGEQCGLTIFPDGWEKVQQQIKDFYNSKFEFEIGGAIHFGGSVNVYEDEIGLVLDGIYLYQPPPQRPSDLKAKKVSLKSAKEKIDIEKASSQELFDQIEDELYEEGLLELNDEND